MHHWFEDTLQNVFLQASAVEKGIAALGDMPPSDCDISGVTFLANPRDLPKARDLIREFRTEMRSLLESGTSRSAAGGEDRKVFQLQVCYFPLSKTLQGFHRQV